MFYTSRLIVTIGSILVPAFLSIQGSGATLHHAEIYWTTWIISLLVTIFNGILILFKIDRKYYFLNALGLFMSKVKLESINLEDKELEQSIKNKILGTETEEEVLSRAEADDKHRGWRSTRCDSSGQIYRGRLGQSRDIHAIGWISG
jgi:hypothetical protein